MLRSLCHRLGSFSGFVHLRRIGLKMAAQDVVEKYSTYCSWLRDSKFLRELENDSVDSEILEEELKALRVNQVPLTCRQKVVKLLQSNPVQFVLCIIILLDAGIVIAQILLDINSVKAMLDHQNVQLGILSSFVMKTRSDLLREGHSLHFDDDVIRILDERHELVECSHGDDHDQLPMATELTLPVYSTRSTISGQFSDKLRRSVQIFDNEEEDDYVAVRFGSLENRGTWRTDHAVFREADGTARVADGTARAADGTTREADGTARNVVGTGRASFGTARDVVRTERESVGTAKKSFKTAREADGTARDVVLTERESFGTARKTSRATRETAGSPRRREGVIRSLEKRSVWIESDNPDAGTGFAGSGLAADIQTMSNALKAIDSPDDSPTNESMNLLDDDMTSSAPPVKRTCRLEARRREHHDVYHEVAHGLHLASIAILGLLVVEDIIKIVAMGKSFCQHKMEIYDAVIISASFTMDLVFLGGVAGEEGQKAAGILVILLIWRIARVIDGIVMTVKQRQEFRIALQKRARRIAEKKLEQQEEERLAKEKEIEALKELCLKAGVRDEELTACVPKQCRRISRTMCALSSVAQFSINVTMSVPSQIDPDLDTTSSGGTDKDEPFSTQTKHRFSLPATGDSPATRAAGDRRNTLQGAPPPAGARPETHGQRSWAEGRRSTVGFRLEEDPEKGLADGDLEHRAPLSSPVNRSGVQIIIDSIDGENGATKTDDDADDAANDVTGKQTIIRVESEDDEALDKRI